MSRLKDETFRAAVLKFVTQHVPTHSMEQKTESELRGERVTVPCPGYNVGSVSSRWPHSIREVVRWVTGYPLDTIQCVIHQTWPDTIEYIFDWNSQDVDKDIFFTTTWGLPPGTPGSPAPFCAVFVQPPWVLSPKDFELFVGCRALPRMNAVADGMDVEYTAKERVWAKVWDECFRRRCHWFVITTYWGWAFGAFSQGWTVGYISNFHLSGQLQPTILECLIFWLGSSMGKSGGWQIPEVSREPAFIPRQIPCTFRDIILPSQYVQDRSALFALSLLS